jgi:transcriptional regulator with XRE-family HTH domain
MHWHRWFIVQLEESKARDPKRGIRKLAQTMGISPAYLHSILNDEAIPTEELFHRILRDLSVPLDESAKLGLSLLIDQVTSPVLRNLLKDLEKRMT